LLHHSTEAGNGLWRARNNLEAALHSHYLEELLHLFSSGSMRGPGSPSDTPEVCMSEKKPGYALGYSFGKFAFFRVRAGELADEFVMTSWHLDLIQRARLYREICSPEQGEAIRRAAEWLQSQ